jgi:hypothetical protein
MEYIQQKSKSVTQAGGMAQLVEYLRSKCETLTSNNSTTKKKKNQLLVYTIPSFKFR